MLLVLAVHTSFAQKYMNDIVDKSCQCVETLPDTLAKDTYNIRFGACMLEATRPYAKQLKKDYGIRLENIDTEAERLGSIIGVKMASRCPNLLLQLTERLNHEDDTEEEEETISGIVTKIEEDFFVSFSIKESSGKISKLYWLTYADASVELKESYTYLPGKFVEIKYFKKDFFDPKIKDYRQFSIISELTVNESILLR